MLISVQITVELGPIERWAIGAYYGKLEEAPPERCEEFLVEAAERAVSEAKISYRTFRRQNLEATAVSQTDHRDEPGPTTKQKD